MQTLTLHLLQAPFTLAQAITTVTTSDKTFGGFTTLLVNAFWAAMLAAFVIGVILGMVAAVMSFRQQEVPFMLLACLGSFLGVPALSFILGRMMGLTNVMSFFG